MPLKCPLKSHTNCHTLLLAIIFELFVILYLKSIFFRDNVLGTKIFILFIIEKNFKEKIAGSFTWWGITQLRLVTNKNTLDTDNYIDAQ